VLRRFRPWQLAIMVVALCVAAVAVARWWRVSSLYDAARLVSTLPVERATVVYLDTGQLRRSGLLDLLAGSKAIEEPDYRKFVDETGFDYRTDLDAVAAAFLRGDVYLALRCRFNWRQLSKYAREQGGTCVNTVCNMPASTPDRYISFYPLQSDILALAVTADQRGVSMIGPGQWTSAPQIPAEPIWISAPSFVFSDVKSLPEGTHSFLSPLAQAQRITFAVGPHGDRFEIRLDVTCADSQTAAALADQLTRTTDLLKKMLDRQHMAPNSQDLSGVLVAGNFEQQNQRVLGTWPVARGFIAALAAGKVQ